MKRRLLGFAVLGLVVAIQVGCGSDDTKKKSVDGGGDAADGTSTGGGSGTGGSGGTAGTAATGGAGGTSGTGATGGAAGSGGSAGADASAGSGGAAGSAGADAGITCAKPVPVEAGVDGAAGGAGAAEGGVTGGQWLDYSTGQCVACPATSINCAQFINAPEPVIDPATGMVSFEITPGTAQIVSGTWSFYYTALDGDGGSQYLNASVPLTVNGNTLTADVGSAVGIPMSMIQDVSGPMVLEDACGTNSDMGLIGSSFGFYLQPLDLDAGVAGADGGDAATQQLVLRGNCVTD